MTGPDRKLFNQFLNTYISVYATPTWGCLKSSFKPQRTLRCSKESKAKAFKFRSLRTLSIAFEPFAVNGF